MPIKPDCRASFMPLNVLFLDVGLSIHASLSLNVPYSLGRVESVRVHAAEFEWYPNQDDES